MRQDVLELLARDWMARDPDPETRAEIEALLVAGDAEGLKDRFGTRLQFGTAGLRGALGAGPNRMNRVLVRTVSLGLADYLMHQVTGAPDKGVVVAYDARKNSRVFAEDTAACFASRGFRVWITPQPTPTPIASFAMVDLGAVAAVVVTASHNPPEDNGYKVFWGDGAQIVSPHDEGISAAIDAVEAGGVSSRPLPSLTEGGVAERVSDVPSAVFERYHAAVQALRAHPLPAGQPGATVVYSAMHGVGAHDIERAVTAAGHTVISVPEQREPDPRFPTVRFPNPEEPGALDLAIALAAKHGADAVIANDPDADRLAVALPRPAHMGEGPAYVQLTGNQVGVLLADALLGWAKAQDVQDPLVATTIVSSAMLKRMASAYGAAYAETLTGFKWIGQEAIAHSRRGGRFLVGFEEALGYSAGDVVRDKDGVSTAVLLVDLLAWHKAQGRDLWQALFDLYSTHGAHVSGQVARKLTGDEGKARIQAVLSGLRADPPASLAGQAVVCSRDVLHGTCVTAGDGPVADRTTALDLPVSNVLAWDLADGSRVLVRPSGTEPKIKLYFEARAAVGPDGDVPAALAQAESTLQALKTDLLQRTGL